MYIMCVVYACSEFAKVFQNLLLAKIQTLENLVLYGNAIYPTALIKALILLVNVLYTFICAYALLP